MGAASFDPADLSKRTKALAVVGLAAAVLFIFGHDADIYWLRMVTKAVPVLCMALAIAFQTDKGRYQWLVITGLLFCAGGDLLLEASPATFVFGLVSFLLGHVFYIAAFVQDCRKPYWGRAALAYGYGVLIFAVLFFAGDLGDMTIPVLAYVIVICTMLWRAAARYGDPEVMPESGRTGFWGAVMFVFSDTVLAVSRFGVLAHPYLRYVVIISYWLGQLDITRAAITQKKG
ncbi:MAG: lysoplasmalogenase [Candidatus Promineifilaceae bacterium]|nr:lysoplasmalogenase [Candidatus Promineifilaceae bacterium]